MSLLARYSCLAAAVLGAGCVHYTPQPLTAAQTARSLESRTLSDAGLRGFITADSPRLAQPWPRQRWDLSALTLAGFYWHPSLEVARANVDIAKAGLITAGMRPNPTVAFAPKYTSMGTQPWTLGLSLDIPIETAGKRGHRLAQARQITEASRIMVAETGWKVRSGVRAALLNELLAQRDVELLQSEITTREQVLVLMEQRFAVGEISRTELEAARTQLVQARVALRAAEGRAQEFRVVVATALGVPPSAVAGLSFEWPDLERLPGADVLSVSKVQSAGLLNRLDVRRALAEYEVTERALQLAIARQYPDVRLQPGYQFDQGQDRFALGLALELPVLNQNQGPIAEAQARRAKSAADFLALQAQIIGELHRAQAQYQGALAELHEVEGSLSEIQQRTEKLTQRAVELGESDRLALTSVQLQRIIVSRARLDALRRAQTALGALEDAVQRPLTVAGGLPSSFPQN